MTALPFAGCVRFLEPVAFLQVLGEQAPFLSFAPDPSWTGPGSAKDRLRQTFMMMRCDDKLIC